MKHVYAAALVFAGLVAGTAAVGEVPGGGGTPVVVGATDAPSQDKVICRTAKIIGSRLKSAPICKTAKQWKPISSSSAALSKKARTSEPSLVIDPPRLAPAVQVSRSHSPSLPPTAVG